MLSMGRLTTSGKETCTWKLCVGLEQYCRRKNSVVISGRQIRESGSQTKHRWLIHLFSRFLGNLVHISVQCCHNSGQFYEVHVLLIQLFIVVCANMIDFRAVFPFVFSMGVVGGCCLVITIHSNYCSLFFSVHAAPFFPPRVLTWSCHGL